MIYSYEGKWDGILTKWLTGPMQTCVGMRDMKIFEACFKMPSENTTTIK